MLLKIFFENLIYYQLHNFELKHFATIFFALGIKFQKAKDNIAIDSLWCLKLSKVFLLGSTTIWERLQIIKFFIRFNWIS